MKQKKNLKPSPNKEMALDYMMTILDKDGQPVNNIIYCKIKDVLKENQEPTKKNNS